MGCYALCTRHEYTHVGTSIYVSQNEKVLEYLANLHCNTNALDLEDSRKFLSTFFVQPSASKFGWEQIIGKLPNVPILI